MRWVIVFCLLVFHQNCNIYGKIAHLVVFSSGGWSSCAKDSKDTEILTPAHFLPPNTNISVQTKKWFRDCGNGYQFRFGAATRFKVDGNKIALDEGSMMVVSRKLENELLIESPESKTIISGMGCFLVEVGTSGGLKMIGILGRSTVKCTASNSQASLMPGELFFHMPGNRGFGEKVNLNSRETN